MRSDLLSSKNEQRFLSSQGLVCRSPQLLIQSRGDVLSTRSNPMEHRTSSASAVSTRTARCRRPLLGGISHSLCEAEPNSPFKLNVGRTCHQLSSAKQSNHILPSCCPSVEVGCLGGTWLWLKFKPRSSSLKQRVSLARLVQQNNFRYETRLDLVSLRAAHLARLTNSKYLNRSTYA